MFRNLINRIRKLFHKPQWAHCGCGGKQDTFGRVRCPECGQLFRIKGKNLIEKTVVSFDGELPGMDF